MLPDPSNGRVDTSGETSMGSIATYSCDVGYLLVGEESRTCGSNGTWNGSQPECRGECIKVQGAKCKVRSMFGMVCYCNSSIPELK
jgi:hypothetical protein